MQVRFLHPAYYFLKMRLDILFDFRVSGNHWIYDNFEKALNENRIVKSSLKKLELALETPKKLTNFLLWQYAKSFVR